MAKRTITARVDDDLVEEVIAQAEKRGETLTAVIIKALQEYAGGQWAPPPVSKPGAEPSASRGKPNPEDCPHPKARRQKGLCMACGTHVG